MYRVQLDQFEGPLDLLLFFIKRDELNIYDIPISQITAEFLDYIHFIREMDLELASDFIYMASFLLSIKARMMLPQVPDEDGQVEDPRAELTAMLLEHKQFKEAAAELTDSANRQSNHFPRLQFAGERQLADTHSDPGLEIALQDVTLWDMMVVYRKIMQEQPRIVVHEIRKITITIEDQINYIKTRLGAVPRFSFRDVLSDLREKIAVVITFLAVLELAKLQQVNLFVTDDLTDFYIVPRDTPDTDSAGEEISTYG